MEINRKNGAGEELAVRENADQRLSKELLDFTCARLPKFGWLRERNAPEGANVE